MKMENVCKCDACSKLYEVGTGQKMKVQVRPEESKVSNEYYDLDLCPSCVDSLHRYIMNIEEARKELPYYE